MKNNSGCGYSTPMISGTEHANELAACTPYSSSELHTAQTGKTYGFVFRHVLGGCMHCALWTRLDILTACLVLAQYQSAPGTLHFRALKHLVGYIRLHPDIPLTVNQSSIAKDVQSINFELLDPTIQHQVGSLLLLKSHPPASMYHLTLILKDSAAATISFSLWTRQLKTGMASLRLLSPP